MYIMRCPQCGFENPDTAQFCGVCTRPLVDIPTSSSTNLSSQPLSIKQRIFFHSLSVLWLLIVAFDIIALILWVPGAWNERLMAALGIVGIYGMAIGFLSRSTLSTRYAHILEGLTSPSPLRYIAGNLGFISLLVFIISAGFTSKGPPKERVIMGKIGRFILITIGRLLFITLILLLIPLVIIDFLVVAPLSYIAILLVSAIVSLLIYSELDLPLFDNVDLSESIKEHPATIKGFMVGIPAVLLTTLTAISTILFL